MGKYEPLGQFLKKQKADLIPMTFTEIERILNAKLPLSKRNRAWWSNNPENNVMTKEWLAAGYKTVDVNPEGGKIVFQRAEGQTAPVQASDFWERMKGLKGMVTLPEDFDPDRPFHDLFDWETWENEKYGPLKEPK